jgi:hypothetical protein
LSSFETIIESKLKSAITVNGLAIPANLFASHINRYSEPAIFASQGYGPYTTSLGGSMTKVRSSGRYFALMTRHQLDKGAFDYDQISVLNREASKMVTTEKVLFQTFADPNEPDFDCVICEFTTPVAEGLLAKSGWYDIKGDLMQPGTPKPSIVCAIGYPGYRNEINFETMHYGISPSAIYGEEAETSLTDRLSFKPINDLDYDPAGLSGSPVFGVSVKTLEPSAFLAGIVTEASRKKVHFVSLQRLQFYFGQI